MAMAKVLQPCLPRSVRSASPAAEKKELTLAFDLRLLLTAGVLRPKDYFGQFGWTTRPEAFGT